MTFTNTSAALSASFLATAVFLLVSCSNPESENTILLQGAYPKAEAAAIPADTTELTPAPTAPAVTVKAADAATVLARPQVPILCYHQVRDWRANDSEGARTYIVPTERFKEQIKMLADSGYHTVLPDQLLAYLNYGTPLPPKPIMLTFDDTNLDQYTIAAPELEKYGFKGVFFVMTVSLGRPRYMSKAQVKELSDAGHVIGSHTWDHHNVKKYAGNDWVTQVEKPSSQLADITGKEIKYFAYPFGLWKPEAIPELKSRGMVAAFQLAGKYDEQDPLYSIRRIIASGYWSPRSLHGNMVNSFD